MSFGKIKLDRADIIFSKYIRLRDRFTCQRCHTFYPDGNGLHCAHFWSRRHESTRFEPSNAIAACFGCHQRLDADKQGEFREMMIKRLGEDGYKKLEQRHYLYQKKDRKMEYLKAKALYEQTQKENKV